MKGKCERCGRKKVPLTKHSPQGNHDESFVLDNWEYMCRMCHDKIHGMKNTTGLQLMKKKRRKG